MDLLAAILTGLLAVFGLADSATLSSACCDVAGDNDGRNWQ